MRKIIILIVSLTLMISCFKPKSYDLAIDAFNTQKWDEAVSRFAKLVLEEPENIEYKVKLQMAKSNASKFHAREGRKFRMKNNYEMAAKEFNKALFFDSENQYTADELKTVLREITKQNQLKYDNNKSLELMKEQADKVTGLKILDPSSNEPIDLYFPEKTSLRKIFHSLGKATSINVLFDNSFQDKQIAIDLRNMVFYDALKALMISTGHFYKVIDSKTILILQDSKQNHTKYDDKIIKTYYLSYAKPELLKNNLRLMTGIKEVFDNKDLNCVVVMGTPQQISIADRIVSLNDKPKSEVVVNFELMEINRSNADKLGILPVSDLSGSPSYKLGAGLIPYSTSDSATGAAPGFADLNNSSWQFLFPFLQLDFLKSLGEVKDISNPTVRISEGETGKILIGQSVPVATTSFTPFTGSTTGNSSVYGTGGQPLTSFNYQEVGIKIEVKPRVHHNGDISLELKLEISSIVDEREGFQPVIGKRTVEQVIRVQSGEPVILAGLLKDTERNSMSGIKGLADIPILKYLFSNKQKTIEQTDIMMSITPHIVRGPSLVEEDMEPFVVGSSVESNFSPRGPFKKIEENNVEEKTEENSVNISNQKKLIPAPLKNENENDNDNVNENENVIQDKVEKDDVMDKNVENKNNDFKTGDFNTSISMMPAMLSLTPRKSNGNIGETFVKTLFATNLRDVDMVDMVLQYDPQIINVLDVKAGDFFGADGVAVSFIPAWDNKNGKLALTIDRKGGTKGRSGTGILANIVFKSVGAGNSEISLVQSSKIVAKDGAEVNFRLINGKVTVE